jgi:hypothetical protein
MKSKIQLINTLFVVAAVLMGAAASVRADDDWFVLGEQTLKPADPSTEITSQGDRWKKDVKRVKFSVNGADVQIIKVVLNWDNRPDKILSDLGTIKSGGETAPTDAPGRKGRLTGVKIQYKVLGDAPATFKVWGFD